MKVISNNRYKIQGFKQITKNVLKVRHITAFSSLAYRSHHMCKFGLRFKFFLYVSPIPIFNL